jgi:hypothetical protein
MEDKEFYEKICSIEKDIVEIKSDMKHVVKAAEGFVEIKTKVSFHNKYIWMMLVMTLGTIFWMLKKYI